MIYQKHAIHGRHIAVNGLEAEANRKNNWFDVTENEFYNREQILKVPEEPDEELNSAVLLYEEKYGNKPHHRMGKKSILKALDDNGE